MIKAVFAALFVLILAGTAAANDFPTAPVPEIDAATAVGAVVVVTSGVFMLRARRKR